jgi:glycosyltransferase involved in cell wall biosynthesis
MLSVAIITKNEEERLPDCLKSVHFADDIAVIDSESTDQTIAIAKNLGARIFIEPWKGYARQKQSAVDHCLYDWVLILDADERVPPATAAVRYSTDSGCSSGLILWNWASWKDSTAL